MVKVVLSLVVGSVASMALFVLLLLVGIELGLGAMFIFGVLVAVAAYSPGAEPLRVEPAPRLHCAGLSG